MPLWLSEDDVASLVTPGEAVPVIEDCFRRMAAGEVELMPRRRFPVEGGYFAVMAAADRGLGVAGLKSYTLVEGELTFVVCLFDLADGSLTATIAADRLGQVRTGAASGVAAKHLARPGATSLGLIGAGWQAESQLAAIRAAVPSIERVVVSSRTAERAEAFAGAHDAEVAESPADAGGCDVVVTVTTSRDPVLRGDWLREGALVCAVGANDPRARELDAQVIARATLVCCDSLEDAQDRVGRPDRVRSRPASSTGSRCRSSTTSCRASYRAASPTPTSSSSSRTASRPGTSRSAHEVVRRARERGVGVEL